MKRYAIDPAQFTDGEWEELYNASTITPRTMEARSSARPFHRPRKSIELAIECCINRADEVREMHDDDEWAEDLSNAALRLREILGPPTRSQARARLYDLLTSDIYTDAPEYAARVSEIHDLIPLALGGK